MVLPPFYMPSSVLMAIHVLAADVPPAAVAALATEIAARPPGAWPEITARAQGAVAHPHYRARAQQLVDEWYRSAPELSPASIALALEAAAQSVTIARSVPVLDLVWTGPHGGILRRTDQALLQLIDEAKRDLLVVTFAAYKVDGIREALGRAIGRGVQVRIVIESPLESDGKVAYDGLLALGPSVAERARVYRWPLHERPVDETGRHGSLHAKCAVADEQTLLVSSANLTMYALTLNLEVGLLLTGGTLPRQMVQQFTTLIRAGTLVAV